MKRRLRAWRKHAPNIAREDVILARGARMPRLGNAGQTMAEAAIAMLLIALAAAGIFQAVLTAKMGVKASESKETATLCANLLFQELRSYVTDTNPVTGLPFATADVAALNPPGSPAWHLPGDTCPGLPADCWALAAGNHVATGLLPVALRNPPYNAIMTYAVSIATVNGLETRKVEARVDWTEPQS